MTRIEKKRADHWRDFDAIMEWHQDHRGCLLEAMEENSDLRIIQRQFKRRWTTRGRHNRYFSRTRMIEYMHIAIDNRLGISYILAFEPLFSQHLLGVG